MVSQASCPGGQSLEFAALMAWARFYRDADTVDVGAATVPKRFMRDSAVCMDIGSRLAISR